MLLVIAGLLMLAISCFRMAGISDRESEEIWHEFINNKETDIEKNFINNDTVVNDSCAVEC